MKTIVRLTLGGLVAYMFALALTVKTTSAQLQPTAVADVRDRLSRFIGTARFVEEQGGVHITGTLSNLPPGAHGFHIGNVAKCLSPTFASAGSIFNPTNKKHGLRNPAGPQLGDLPSLVVSPNGAAILDVVASGATLSNGAASLIGGNGTALVIHVGDDDQVTDPEGNAGERLACGVILPTDPEAASATAQSRGPTAAQGLAGQTSAAPAVAQPPVSAAPQPAATERTPTDMGTILGSPPAFAVLGLLLVGAGYLVRRSGPSRG